MSSRGQSDRSAGNVDERASLFDDDDGWDAPTRAGELADAEVQALFRASEQPPGADISDLDLDDLPTRIGVTGEVAPYEARGLTEQGDELDIEIDVAPVLQVEALSAAAMPDSGIRARRPVAAAEQAHEPRTSGTFARTSEPVSQPVPREEPRISGSYERAVESAVESAGEPPKRTSWIVRVASFVRRAIGG